MSPIEVSAIRQHNPFKYSICTLVTDKDEYNAMVDSFKSKGFDEPDCEFMYMDNSAGNSTDAFDGYNMFLNAARGDYVIVCHQDVLLIDDGRTQLDAVLAALSSSHPNWAICGNAGGLAPLTLAIRITDPGRKDDRIGGPFPVKVGSLDENFLVVRRETRLALSRDVGGFHFYGTDLCLIADILGYGAYVVDFHLQHKSPGTQDASFLGARDKLLQKYRHALRPRLVTTTCTDIYLGHPLINGLINRFLMTRVFAIASWRSKWLRHVLRWR